MKIDPNAPAYPVDLDSHSHGLSIRAHFAAMAMQGMIDSITRMEEPGTSIIPHRPIEVAEISVVYADALIAELNK